ncbi:hypothetical protein [Egicoccus sp. AB-alg2]|uniref:hypothetical protein n=1 Tax=Egicoccus sp. AB-alg2 TaxID=3242693 RepID=UPI00359E144C
MSEPSIEGRRRTSGDEHRTLQVVVLPVADIERAKDFYRAAGWRVDGDFDDHGYHVIHVTPPTSAFSIIFAGAIDGQHHSLPATAWELESPETAWFWWSPAANTPNPPWP